MGTNYYAHFDCCDKCGRPDSKLHIGKSSWGWVFSLAIHPEKNIHDWPDWERELAKPSVRILDEYYEVVALDELVGIVTKRERYEGKPGREDQYSMFDEKTGLMRAKIGPYCSKHGEGTWDCHFGEFS